MICAPISYNFYQVSPLLRLIIYYFWEVFKILPNIYSNPLLCAVSLLSVYLTRTRTSVAIVSISASVNAILHPHKRSVLISAAFLLGKAVHFFYIVSANSALFAKKNGCKLSDKRPKKFFGNAWCREQSRGPPCNNSI